MEEQISMHSHKPNATSQPSLHMPAAVFSHTHSLTAQQAQLLLLNNAPYTCPIMTSALALQSQHRNTNPAHAR